MISGKIKKNYSNSFKLKVALAALKADKTVSEMCQEFAVTSGRIYEWKKRLEERGTEVFEDKSKSMKNGVSVEKLHAIIGKLIVDREFLLKKIGF